MHDTVIVIPARYHSSRFPGKPLALLAGKTMLARVVAVANQFASEAQVLVATDDQRIVEHSHELAVTAVLTPTSCLTGTDRVWAAVQTLPIKPSWVINLQGDAPLTPPHFIAALLAARASEQEILTPVTQLTWPELDELRHSKQTTPFSGTTVVVDQHDRALWFSKTILPALRQEQTLRQQTQLSPVLRHIGLYAYRYAALKRWVELAEAHYEHLEGLEQLRALENGLSILGVRVDYQGLPAMTGIDTPQDLQRAERLLNKKISKS